MKETSFQQLWQQLVPLYGAGEARALVRMLMETQFGITLSDLLCYGTNQLDETQQRRLNEMICRLKASEPIQYVMGETLFCGRVFHVEPGVLIPRPETEMLCRWVVDSSPLPSPKKRNPFPSCRRILDIGCGSGCIAITLALEIEGAQVIAWDISPKALEVTQRNADLLGARIVAEQRDILAITQISGNGKETEESACAPDDNEQAGYDIIVSNPPYICRHEEGNMHPNVLQHEPHEALFVPDTDPLCFYSAIARFAADNLRPGGLLFFECNAAYTQAVAHLLSASGFSDVTTREDDFGKTRFVKAQTIQKNLSDSSD